MDLSLFGIVNNIRKLTNENFGQEDGSETFKKLTAFEGMLIVVSLIVAISLLIWAIVVLSTFQLPQEILILSIVLLFLTGPVIPLVLAYVFRNKKL